MEEEDINTQLERLQRTQSEILENLATIEKTTHKTHKLVGQIANFILIVILGTIAFFALTTVYPILMQIIGT